MANRSQPTDPSRLAVNTLKMLAVDAVEKARSGHPGLPMGAADYAFVLWTRYLRFDPSDPNWPNRDRFVLSAGHGSMLVYGLLHLSGYDVTLEDLRQFRQWGSRTPGHPEKGCLPGVEVTTGPLGQGVGNMVGMAMAERMLAVRVNTPRHRLIDHRIYGICSDGDLMEGVASEAASIAGHLGLGNIILFYDDNRISIDGPTDITFSEDVAARFAAYGWHVQSIDGHDHAAAAAAIEAAQGDRARPSIIVARTHIGHGSPGKQDSAAAHGAPLGPEEARATKQALGWPEEPTFHVPDEVRGLFAARVEENRRDRDAWKRTLADYRKHEPDRARRLDQHLERHVPLDLEKVLLLAAPEGAGATRSHGGKILQTIAGSVPSLVGGAADLVESTKTHFSGSPSIAREDFTGRNIHFGVREHAMGAIANGLAYHGSFIPFASTFLIFSDYMRPAMRLAALSELQVIYVFTHDSVFLGEDGPTHQPVEHLASLRAMPNMHVVRPADGRETAMAWVHALRRREGPTSIILTRQNLPALKPQTGWDVGEPFTHGGYVHTEASGSQVRVAIVATGSEVAAACDARGRLEARGIPTRVVSMPCVECFRAQPAEERAKVVPASGAARVVVLEAAATLGWREVAGDDALLIGVDRSGVSAPWERIAAEFGLTGEAVAGRIEEWIGGK